MTADEEPSGTASGWCRRCGHWSAEGRVVGEIHTGSAAGMTVVECPRPCRRPSLRGARTRTYPL